jgi:hypothetical protein
MSKSNIIEKSAGTIVRSSGWVIDSNQDISLYLAPLYQDRCYRISPEFGSHPWSLCSLENGAFFLVPIIDEGDEGDDDPFFIHTDFCDIHLSAEGLGISSTLYACAMLSGSEDYDLAHSFACLYHSLRQHAETHVDGSEIMAAAI